MISHESLDQLVTPIVHTMLCVQRRFAKKSSQQWIDQLEMKGKGLLQAVAKGQLMMNMKRLRGMDWRMKVSFKGIFYIFENHLINNSHNCPRDINLVFTKGTIQLLIGFDDDIESNTNHE